MIKEEKKIGNNLKLRCACIIPSYNGVSELSKLFDSLENQKLKTKILVVDSSSIDGSYELAVQRADEVIRIDSSEFNHGRTRQHMVNTFNDFDIYIFLTQDAYLANPNSLSNIIEAFSDPKVGAACGRQLPHIDANPIASHARLFNYPSHIKIKNNKDIPSLGIKTAFISNSFSAYRKEALIESGGFPSDVILSEDMYVAAKMILNGWKIAYQGNSLCHHSHNYTILEEARRYFDIGVFFSEQPWIKEKFGSPKGEGIKFIKSEFIFLLKNSPALIPKSIVRNFFKIVFFKLGNKEKKIPKSIKIKLSMHKKYWDSK